MKKISLILSIMMGISAMAQAPYSSKMTRKDVAEVCNAVAEWQIQHISESKHHSLDWTSGALYRGIFEWGETVGNQDCFDFLKGIGVQYRWNMHDRTYHADDICVGQTFIEMYRRFGDEKMIRPVRERAFWVASHPSDAPLLKTDARGCDDRWSWCDALFMAAPVYAALYNITGEKVYADYLDNEFRECADSLYDKEDHLFYRDCMRISLREPNGAKQFWGRGNGWVFGCLPLVLENLPTSHPSRNYYIEMFRDMANKLVKIQDEKGAWHSSLLDPVTYPLPENSASAFFCYGLAWGINKGILKGGSYSKALSKGWEQLVGAVHKDGKLGFIQPVGAAPKGEVGAESSDIYGIGAFLLAGSEIWKMSKK